MRIFAGLLGGMFLLLGLAGLAAAVVFLLGNSYDDPNYLCEPTATGGTVVRCEADSSGDSATQAQTVVLGLGVLGGALFVGGCALLGGAAAAGRRPAPVAGPQQFAGASPAATAGPPSYGGGGWQGQPGGGDPAPRS